MTIRSLETRLLQELPGLQPWLTAAAEEHGGPPDGDYWLFSYVVKPYLEALERGGDDALTAVAWRAFEGMAADGSASEQNELRVTLEEMDLHRFFRFMGPMLRGEWFENVTWYPTHEAPHVSRTQYQQRWREEIRDIGGFERLDAEAEMLIRYKLTREFSIKGLRAPKPGSRDWRRAGLP